MGYGPPRYPQGGYGNNFNADEPGVPGEEGSHPPLPPGPDNSNESMASQQGNWNHQPVQFSIGSRMPGFNPIPPQINNGKKNKKKKNKEAQKLAAEASSFPDSIPTPPGPPPPQSNSNNSEAQNSNKFGSVAPQDWPESLKNYVAKCFGKCKSDLDKDQVEIILKGKITTAATNGSLWTKNWDEEPLPVTLLSAPLGANASPSKRGKYSFPLRGGRGGFSKKGFGRGGRYDEDSSSDESSSNSRGGGKNRKKSKQPNFGDNPNKIPLGRKGLKTKFGKVPYFYSDGSMTLDKDLATQERKQKRAARFQRGEKPVKSAPLNLIASLNNQLLGDFEETTLQWEGLHLVGTSTDLEKRFFRLTSAPEVSQIRPLEILKKSLELVVNKWKKAQDYHYACDQLKSIRQDLTVSTYLVKTVKTKVYTYFAFLFSLKLRNETFYRKMLLLLQ